MVVRKRKKNTRMRATTTHGYGSRKKHRGAGSRGGRGMAGSGKRACTKKPSIWENTKYFGKYGFKIKSKKTEIKPVNVIDLEKRLDDYLEKKLISKQKDVYVIELAKLGFNKLLGNGKVREKLKITTAYASKKAVEKIKKAGGEVILLKKQKQVEEEKAEKELALEA